MALGTIAQRLAELAEKYERRGDDPAWTDLRRFGEALEVVGGVQLMTQVYDATIDRHGYRSCHGVTDCWREIPGWHP